MTTHTPLPALSVSTLVPRTAARAARPERGSSLPLPLRATAGATRAHFTPARPFRTRLWTQSLLDRLTMPLTRYHE